MNLYTVVCECRGGTYVEQVRAADELQAVVAWTEAIALDRRFGRSTHHVVRKVLRDREEYGLAALDGLAGVWHFHSLVGGDSVSANMVLTAADLEAGRSGPPRLKPLQASLPPGPDGSRTVPRRARP